MNIEQFHDPIDILRAAKMLLSEEDRLVRDGRNKAEDADGRRVGSTAPAACRFCMLGAVCACASSRRTRYEASRLLVRACDELRFCWVAFIDRATGKRLTVAQVQQVFDRAIVLGGGEPEPIERNPATLMTMREEATFRGLLNTLAPGLGDRTMAWVRQSSPAELRAAIEDADARLVADIARATNAK